jgi:hypothetical protein
MLNFLDAALYIFKSIVVETFSSPCSSNRKRYKNSGKCLCFVKEVETCFAKKSL